MHSKRKNLQWIKDLLISLMLALSFIFFSILLPSYDNVNGFHNLIFDNYNLTWYDGRSPANFYVVKSIIENRSFSFPEGYLIGNMRIENHFDFIRTKNGRFFPIFNYPVDYLYASVLALFPITSNLQLFKGMILLNIIICSFSLILLYFIQKLLGLNTKFSMISTLAAGAATGTLIYSRYLFVQYTLINFLFLILLFLMLKYRNLSKKQELPFLLFFSLFLTFLWYWPLVIIFFLIFSYFFLKFKIIKSPWLLLLPALIIFIALLSLYSPYFGHTQWRKVTGITDVLKLGPVPLIRIFSRYINSLDFSVYGYHNQTSTHKLSRNFGYIYAFKEKPGNALFLRFYGLFASLFEAKGIIYNSPFLIFSLLGIFTFKKKKKRNLLLTFVIILILIYGFFNSIWYGGVTPRYNRFLLIPTLLLTFFSFYYIQKTKKLWIRLVFVILLTLSILNISSLAVRADWTYQRPADLVSYDLVLWPWYPPKLQQNIINLYLTEEGESIEWEFGSEAQCKVRAHDEGIITEVCNCEYATYARRSIKIPWRKFMINVTACSIGGDGVIGRIFFDNFEKELFIHSRSCERKSFVFESSKEQHTIILKPKRYGECTDEIVIWKLITIEKI